jgi:hypothetical protein
LDLSCIANNIKAKLFIVPNRHPPFLDGLSGMAVAGAIAAMALKHSALDFPVVSRDKPECIASGIGQQKLMGFLLGMMQTNCGVTPGGATNMT